MAAVIRLGGFVQAGGSPGDPELVFYCDEFEYSCETDVCIGIVEFGCLLAGRALQLRSGHRFSCGEDCERLWDYCSCSATDAGNVCVPDAGAP